MKTNFCNALLLHGARDGTELGKQEMAQWVFLLAAEMQRGDGRKRIVQTYPMTLRPPVCTVPAISPISPILPPP